MDEITKEANEQTRAMSDEEVRDRVVQLGFHGDAERFERFLRTLREALPADVTVVVRGSTVIGRRWADGLPFDAEGPGTSDLDVALVGGDMLKYWRDDALYIPGLHSAPLDEEHPDAAPELEPLRQQLCKIAGRPVHLQATTSLVQFVRDVLLDQPYHTLIEPRDREEKDGAADEEESLPLAKHDADERNTKPS